MRLPTRTLTRPLLASNAPLRPHLTLRAMATTPKGDPNSSDPAENPYLYSKERDPMAGMSEEEKEAIRKNIRSESQRAFSISYGIIGGGMLAVVSLGAGRLCLRGA
ncbi:hypothetical protein PhCBS80983_g01082 [Powellomyces hirtus]|uniref:Uncharacterized protein n=1 Tax=Powellomyces hirtus TaxID=109895 RepID=A0A507EBI3_9FUNG|nr:hypothetical protein PhCBS80983_g01082 [Powellomyces hirtus]